MSGEQRILVLGVGNVLFTDEGIGVRAASELEREYDFSENVTVMDGGTLGTKLMGPIMDADIMIVMDAVLGDGSPGDIYRLTGEDLRKGLAFRNSLHQTDLVDTLIFCEVAGNRPEAVIIGMEPQDHETMGTELTPVVAGRLPELKKIVLEEIRKLGGTATRRAVPRPENSPILSSTE